MTRINDTEITPRLFNEIVTRRRNGAKIFLVMPEETELDGIRDGRFSPCPNCHGAGKIGIQIIVNGPHDEPHIMAETVQGSEGPQKHNLGCIWYKERWFNAKTILDTCPCCEGRGISVARPAAQPAMQREKVAA